MNTITGSLRAAGFKKSVLGILEPGSVLTIFLSKVLLSKVINFRQCPNNTKSQAKGYYKRKSLSLFIFILLLISQVGHAQVSLTATLGTTTGSYTTVKTAFDAINLGTHKGDIVLTITANVTETATAVINASGSGSASYSSINIYPTTTGLTISGALASPLIDLNGADNIVFDGRVNQAGATDLIITNTNTGTLSSTIRLYNDACNNTLQYCTIKGATTNPSAGVIYLSTANASGTGNTGNIISNCNITKDAAGTPLYLLLSNGTAAKENVATISNNNFYDFGTMAIWGSGPNKNWIINNNSIYQTTTVTGAVGMSLIRMQGGDGFSIYNNYLGGSSANCGGSAFTVNSAGSFSFTGISVYGTTSPASSIYGNTIQNIDITAVNSSNIFCGIYAYNGNVNIGTDGANTIGSSSGTGSITVRSNVNGGAGYSIGIFVPTSTTGTKVISNNIIGSITLGNSNLTSSSGHKFWGIYTLAGTITVSNNTIGSTVTSNSINTSNAQNAGAAADNQYIRAIEVDNGPATITGNTIANLNNSWLVSTASAYGSNYGIYVSSATTATISNNNIYNISTAQPQTGTGSVYGIYFSGSPSTACTVSGNTIYNLSNTSATGAVKVHGIYYQIMSSWNIVEKNFIHSLYTISSTAVQYGIYVAYGYTNFKNNIIRLGIDKDGNSITTTTEIYGFYLSAPTIYLSSIQHNTIYIGGSGVSTATTVYSYGIYKNNTAYDTINNNIIMNVRSNASALVRHYPIYYTSASYIPKVSDYNVYYFTSGHGQLEKNYATMQLFRVFELANLSDFHSAIADPKLVNPTGSTATLDMSISTLLGTTPVEGNGLMNNNVTTDYLNTDRSTVGATDIGAYAGNFNAETVADDHFTPYITYTTFTAIAPQNTYSLTAFATITDQISGVDTSTSTKPRLYYKKSTDANSFGANTAVANGWKWVEATNSSSPYSFTIDNTLIYQGSPASGTIQYFVIAQDLASTPNILCWPLAGSAATGVGSVTTAPTTPNSYIILQAPVAAEETSKTITSFQANWSASTGATSYYLDLATDNLFTSYVAGFENLNVGNVTNYAITSLTSNSTYYYRIRSYNATGLSVNSSTITANTLASEPLTAATAITFTSNLCGGKAYSFARGDGAFCAVFVTAATTGSVTAVDGTTYTANAAYGSGTNVGGWYCLYKGTGSSSYVTGLTNGTTYRFMVVEYSGLATFENYFNSTGTGNPSNYAAVAGSALTGTKYIQSSGGDYATIGLAITALNGCGVGTDGVTFVLGDTTYPSEVFPLTFGAITGASSSNRITFHPASGVGVTISGDYASAMINMNNADFITFDGLNTGGSSLTIKNTNTGVAAATILFTAGATYDIVTNCTVLGSPGHTSGAWIQNGVIAFTTSSNTNIQITYCNIGPAGSNKPGNCIKAGYGNGVNSNITVDHCNLYNWFGDGGNDAYSNISAAINLGYYNTAVDNNNWTITNNSFYFTSEQVYNLGRIHGIYIYHGYNYNITGNYFGGSEPLCGGTAMKASGSPFLMGFVYVDGHTTYGGTNSSYSNSISNNTIQNIDYSSSNITATSDYSDGARFFAAGIHSGKFTIENNLIGSMTATGSIVLNNTTYSEYKIFEFYGPTSSSTFGTQVPKLKNNRVGGITINSAYSDFAFVRSEYNSTNYICKLDSIADNTFGSSVTNNIQATSLTNSSSNFGLINLSTSNTAPVPVVSNNIIQQINITSGVIYGVSSGYSYNAIGNVLRNFTTTGATCLGLSMGANDSYSGIKIANNLIHSLSASTTIYGISASSYYTAIPINNNIIVLGNNVAANVDIRGIYTYYLANVYFNTVVILGTGTSGTVSSYAFYRNSSWTNTMNIKNNLFYNGRTNSGATGSHYAIYIGALTSLSINYNDYYVNGTGGVLGYCGAAKSTIALWRTATSQDVNSINTDPLFASVTGCAPGNYYTGGSINGVTGLSITTDYYGMARGATPKMGAVENLAGIWYGTTSSDFGTASNWLDNIVPATGASIVFASSPSNHCVLDLNRSLNIVTNAQSSKKLDLNGYNLTITGSINFSNGAQIDATAATSGIVFSGSAIQTVPSGSLTNNSINVLNIDNTSGVTLSNPVTVNNSLVLTTGLITTSSSNLLTLGAGAGVSGASDNSFVNGPIKKIGNTGFVFPVGKSGTGYQAIEISAPSNVTDAFTAEYMRADPTTAVGSAKATPLTNVSICEYWQLDRTTGTSSVDVTIYGNSHSGCSSSTNANYFTGNSSSLNDLRLAHWDGSQWEVAPSSGTSVSGTSPAITLTATSVTSYSPFTFGTVGFNPLPVKLTKFVVSNNGSSGILDWNTATEINNERFDIERSIDGINFVVIGSQKGQGNSTSNKSYTFIDLNSAEQGSNIVFYRLKQFDFNGKYSYSKIEHTQFNSSTSLSQYKVSPNPINQFMSLSFTLKAAETVTIEISDCIGNVIYREEVAGRAGINQIQINTSSFAKGIYLIKIMNSSAINSAMKIIKE